jgi:hydrogenase expression/formation protein HypE
MWFSHSSFQGGDIGSMSVFGTVNDLAMSGAKALHLSAGFIIEEGLPMETLWRIVCSMRSAADRCGVQIVTGDTKVVDKGKGDGLFINTAGIGVIEHPLAIAPASVRAGDAVPGERRFGPARHGDYERARGVGLRGDPGKRLRPGGGAGVGIARAGVEIHCLRDLTRGGLASALNEIAEAAKLRILIHEKLIPVRGDVRAACEMLGLDPLLVACEGRFAVFVPPQDAKRTLDILNQREVETVASYIGEVRDELPPFVVLQTVMGSYRILDMPSGEQLPRIC